VNTADEADVRTVEENVRATNPDATLIHADSVVEADGEAIEGRRVLVVEDGPTLTHGGAAYGAGWIAAHQYGAAEIVDPAPVAVGSIARVLDEYPHVEAVLPAMGYSEEQVRDLEATIRNADAEVVIAGTPFDLARVVDVDVPVVRVRYELAERDLTLDEVLDRHAQALGL